jgi:hypothetical protein
MNIQLEINGEQYNGSAFKTKNGLVIHLPGVQAESASSFDALFQPLPETKIDSGFLEVGEWNGKVYPYESQVNFCLGPDGNVWAQICDTPDDLPDSQSLPSNQELANAILDNAEEAFHARSMAIERAANGGWPIPVGVSDFLFWLEDEATIQEDALHSDPQATALDEAYAHALRGVADEIRQLGFSPSPAPWPV